MAWVRLDPRLDPACHASSKQPRAQPRSSRRILFDASNAQGEGLTLYFRRKTRGQLEGNKSAGGRTGGGGGGDRTNVSDSRSGGGGGGQQVMQLFLSIQHGPSAPRPGEVTVTPLCEICTQVSAYPIGIR